MSLLGQFNLNEIFYEIEDSYLERGLFTKLLGREFIIYFTASEIASKYESKPLWSIQLNVESTKKNLNQETAETITQYVKNLLFEIVEHKFGKNKLQKLKSTYKKTQVTFSGKKASVSFEVL
jgi:uncharacterized membrane protein